MQLAGAALAMQVPGHGKFQGLVGAAAVDAHGDSSPFLI